MMWFVIAILTGLAVLSVLAPLGLRRRGLGAEQADRAFYDAQMAEIDRDVTRGLLQEAEASAARAEAGRRLIERHNGAQQAGPSSAGRRMAAALSILLVPAIGLGLYIKLGNPDLQDRPLTARMNETAGANDIFAAIAKIERHLEANPDDARGWEVIAPVYLRTGKPQDAARAFANIVRISGPNPERLTAMGEALTFANEGRVSPEASAAFARAVELDPQFAQARFYLGLAAEQSGDKDKARDIWTRLVADAPPGASWIEPVRARIAALGPQISVPAPNEMMARSITALPKQDQDVAIRGMVERLAARLNENGADAEGWLMLVNSYARLNDRAKAIEALANARKALSNDSSALGKLDTLARQLGLEG